MFRWYRISALQIELQPKASREYLGALVFLVVALVIARGLA